MAITIEGTNQGVLSSGYNPLQVYLSSNNVNELSFRYIVQVFEAGTSVLLFEKKYAPRPVDGYAEVDISRDVQNFLSAHLPFTNGNFQHAPEHFLNFDIKFGEEYVVAWDFDDFIFDAGGTALEQTPTVTPHPFQIGDQVRVKLDTVTNDFRDALNGLFTVTNIPDAYTITTSLPWIGSGTAVSGKVYFADNRKSRFLNLTSATDQTTLNIAIPLREMNTFTGGQFVLNTSPVAKLLTNIPRTVRQQPIQSNWFAFWNGFTTQTIRVQYTNDGGDVAYRSINLNNTQGVVQVASGLLNTGTLTALSGTLPIIKPTTEKVAVRITNDSNVALSESITYQVDRRCNIENYEVAFMDRLGGFSTFMFTLRSTDSGQVNRLTYNQQFGKLNAGLVEHNTYDQGTTIYHVDNTKELTLNTNWMSDSESVYFEELLTSGYTFIKIGTDWFACIVKETAYEIQRAKNKPLIRKTITVMFAVQNPINV